MKPKIKPDGNIPVTNIIIDSVNWLKVDYVRKIIT